MSSIWLAITNLLIWSEFSDILIYPRESNLKGFYKKKILSGSEPNLNFKFWTDRVSIWKTPAIIRQSVNLPKINDRHLLKRFEPNLNSTEELC